MTSLATVYKTIGIMKEMGEVLELEFSQGANRYDGRRPFAHPHVVCTGCGRILDPDVSGIDQLTRQVMAATGFDIDTHRLEFYGRCPQCQ
jgi:Fur family peroxide stress response transcriptional regulator